MPRILKYAKPYIPIVLLSVCLLFLQAYCDLSLPDYMSRIVSIGISQDGIEHAAPSALRESQLNRLMQLLDDNAKAALRANYTLRTSVDFADYGKQYPVLSSENIYTLNKKLTVPIGELNGIFETPYASLPESLRSRAAISYVTSEYEELGMDIASYRMNFILKSGGQMLLFALLSMVTVICVGFLSARFGASFSRDMRKKVFSKVASFSNTEFDTFSTASLITRSTNDVQQVQMFMTMMTRMGFYAPIMSVGGIMMVLRINAGMSWIIAVSVAAILLFVCIMFSFAMPRFKKVQKLVDKVNLIMRESLTGMMVIRAFGTQKQQEKKFDAANTDLTSINLFLNRTMSMMMPVMSIIMSFTSIAIIWFGGHSIDAGTLQVGDMMAFIQYATQILMSFMMISMFSIVLPRASVSADRIADILETEVTVKDINNTEKFGAQKGFVEFRNVSFKYPGADEYVLKNISLKTGPGETTAFIGSTGSGKSTLINLIPRFYDATDGEILVDGINVKNVPQHDLREKIGYVPQKGVLFSGTIESNIKFGGDSITDDDMHKAAETAQAAEFIKEKQNQYADEISQGGSNVSGGQKQRLSIARALAKKPEIYIFDDSFSAVDYKTDASLRAALAKETANSAVLIVAQRINTIRNADRIVVLDEGRVAAIGTHNELVNKCEIYRQIAESQLPKEQLFNIAEGAPVYE